MGKLLPWILHLWVVLFKICLVWTWLWQRQGFWHDSDVKYVLLVCCSQLTNINFKYMPVNKDTTALEVIDKALRKFGLDVSKNTASFLPQLWMSHPSVVVERSLIRGMLLHQGIVSYQGDVGTKRGGLLSGDVSVERGGVSPAGYLECFNLQ